MKEENKKNESKAGNVITFIFLICIGIFVYYQFIKPNLSSTKDTNEYGNKHYSIEVDPVTISDVYYNNELDGNKKYFGKRIKTTGRFTSAEKGALTGWNIVFNTDGIYDYYCSTFVGGEEKHFGIYNRGETLTIYATVDELVGSYINLKECDIER